MTMPIVSLKDTYIFENHNVNVFRVLIFSNVLKDMSVLINDGNTKNEPNF